jgi:hypothetical protein
MTTRMMRMARLTVSSIGCAAFLIAGSGSGGQVFGQAQGGGGGVATYRLASAQVVTSTVQPPMLRLSASGPIAFQVLPTDASGAPVGSDRVVARLYGIAPGDLASSGDLAPFALMVTAEASANGVDTDTLVTIATGAVGTTSGLRLVLRAGMKTSEIEAAIVPVPVQ